MRIRTFPFVALACLCLCLLVPASARAQTQGKLADRLVDFYSDNMVSNLVFFQELQKSYPDLNVNYGDLARQLEPAFQFNRLVASQVSSFPIGSSSGGFTFTFDPALGTFKRSSESFGPLFAERALTLGRKKFNLGFSYQHASFDDMEGKPIGDGSIKVYTSAYSATLKTTVFVEDSLKLKVSTDTITVLGNYGVTDRMDIGFAIPVMSVKLDATLDSKVGLSPGNYLDWSYSQSTSGKASGVGDVVVRAKYRVLDLAGGGIGAGVDVRIGTGDEEELLGIAGNQAKIYFVASGAAGKLSPHVNVGYTISSASDIAKDVNSSLLEPPAEINYVGGFDFALSTRATVGADLVGRTLRKAGRLVDSTASFSSAYKQFAYEEGDLTQTFAAIGGKFAPWSNLLVSANVLVPLKKAGLTDNLTWAIGFDYSF